MTAVDIVPVGYTEPVARTLVDAALADLAERYGGSGTTLETGRAQPEAIALYTKLGYDRIPNFGYYRDHEGCVSFGRSLAA